MKAAAIILLFIMVGGTSFAQKDSTNTPIKKNSIFLELGGTSVTWGLCYERQFKIAPKSRFGVRLGAGTIYFFMAPFFSTEANLMIGKKHAFETGIGYGKGFHEVLSAVTVHFGYRLQKKNGFLFRAGVYMMMLEEEQVDRTSTETFPFVGLSIGKAF